MCVFRRMSIPPSTSPKSSAAISLLYVQFRFAKEPRRARNRRGDRPRGLRTLIVSHIKGIPGGSRSTSLIGRARKREFRIPDSSHSRRLITMGTFQKRSSSELYETSVSISAKSQPLGVRKCPSYRLANLGSWNQTLQRLPPGAGA